MPNHISRLSTTAANNILANTGIQLDGGTPANLFDNAVRNLCATLASYYNQFSGDYSVSGSAGAFAVTSGDSLNNLASFPSPLTFVMIPNHSPSTGQTVTVTVDTVSLGNLKELSSAAALADVSPTKIKSGIPILCHWDGTNLLALAGVPPDVNATEEVYFSEDRTVLASEVNKIFIYTGTGEHTLRFQGGNVSDFKGSVKATRVGGALRIGRAAADTSTIHSPSNDNALQYYRFDETTQSVGRFMTIYNFENYPNEFFLSL